MGEGIRKEEDKVGDVMEEEKYHRKLSELIEGDIYRYTIILTLISKVDTIALLCT